MRTTTRTAARRTAAAITAVMVGLLAAGCASPPHRHPVSATAADLTGSGGAIQNIRAGQILRLGLPADLSPAPALAGTELGLYRRHLRNVALQPLSYLSDLQEIGALEHGQLDAAYLDPVAALAAWQASTPGSLRLIAGVSTGTSQLIARPGITSPAQLRGTRVEAPADSSQAAYLADWLTRNHLAGRVTLDGSAITTIGILRQFTTGTVTAAWEPAPLDQELIAAGGHVLATQPAATTTVLVVTQRFLTANPTAVRNLLTAQIQSCTQDRAHPAATITAAARMLQTLTGSRLTPAVLTASATQVTCTADPGAASLQAQARLAASAAMIRPANLGSLYDLTILNSLLRSQGKQTVKS